MYTVVVTWVWLLFLQGDRGCGTLSGPAVCSSLKRSIHSESCVRQFKNRLRCNPVYTARSQTVFSPGKKDVMFTSLSCISDAGPH